MGTVKNDFGIKLMRDGTVCWPSSPGNVTRQTAAQFVRQLSIVIGGTGSRKRNPDTDKFLKGRPMIKIARRCSRCHRYLYHFLGKPVGRRGLYEAKCADCGHVFHVRPRREEVEDELFPAKD
jgi:hypothetical protein